MAIETRNQAFARWFDAKTLLGFGLGVLVTIVIGLAALGVGGKEWLRSDLPSWLEGLGTVAACILAVVGYREWREQEAAKRRAEAAEKILRAASVMTKTVRESRVAMTIPESAQGDVLKSYADLFTILKGSRVEASGAPSEELQGYQLAAGIYFGEKASEAIEQLLVFRDKLKVTAEYLSKFKAKEMDKESMEKESSKYDEPIEYSMYGDEWLLGLLKTVGVHKDPREVDEKQRRDETDKVIDSTMKNLKIILQQHLTYSAAMAK